MGTARWLPVKWINRTEATEIPKKVKRRITGPQICGAESGNIPDKKKETQAHDAAN
jgi:hypothetical protein